jgi:hypothetical protein
VKEKNHQVGLMQEIYQRASTVIIWLGPSSADSFHAINHIWSLGLSHFEHKPDRKALLALLSRSYWKRMWIIPEIFLAQNILVCCGKEVFLWDELRETLERHLMVSNSWNQQCATSYHCGCWNKNWHKEIRRSPGCRVVRAREQYTIKKSMTTSQFVEDQFVTLLMNWADQECVDPRDKVYALLGLLPQRSPLQVGALQADYQKSTEVLYSELLTLFLHVSGSFKERRDFCVRLQKSLGVCPYNLKVEKTLKSFGPLLQGLTPADFGQPHIRGCKQCRA